MQTFFQGIIFILLKVKMHEAHKRMHDPQLVKHLPGRNHKANMVHLEGCCRERCGVGSETLCCL